MKLRFLEFQLSERFSVKTPVLVHVIDRTEALLLGHFNPTYFNTQICKPLIKFANSVEHNHLRSLDSFKQFIYCLSHFYDNYNENNYII